ncbi:chemotaxis protein CheB [Polynucleobacter sphagniphilus]|uniref:chemotaxis protein CheB n=1 Tax=Polynucleobacter sphagniphilus TaxID=1743169 RepID=UPI0009F9CC04
MPLLVGLKLWRHYFLNLNADFSIPIICVQHISNGFLVRMLDWLQSMTNLKVEIAQEKGVPMAGHLYFPPEGKHLEIGVDGGFRISSPSPGEIYCPNIDKLFASVAESCPSSSVGVILSGMGRDGAIGLKKIFDSGGDTIAQDETSSIIFGMPAAAIELGGVCHVMSVVQIADYLNGLQPYSRAKYNTNSLQPY